MSIGKNLRLEVILQAVDKLTGPLKKVLTGSKGTSREVKELRDRLKDLDRGQKMLGEFKDVNRGLAVTRYQMTAAQERTRALKDQIAKTSAPTKQMAAALKAAQNESAALAMRHGKLAAQQIRLRESLTAAGHGTTNLTAQQRTLKTQADLVSRSLATQTARLQTLNRKQQQMHASRAGYDKGMKLRNNMAGTGAGMVAAGAVAGAAVAAPIKAYADAENAATQLRVAMMTKGAKVAPEFAAITELANTLGNKLPGTTADFQNMMTMLIRQGMSAKSILGGLGQATAYLGVQLQMPVTEAAEFASKLQDATRTSEKDMMGLMDVIQRTSNLGVEHNNMLQAFAKLSPAMDTIKVKGLEGAKALAPLIALADQAGMAGEAAGNAYRKIFQMSMDKKKIGEANAALKSKGIALDFTNGKGEFGGLDKMFAQLSKLRGLNTQARLGVIKKIFGDDAETLQVVSLLIEKGASGYADMQGKMAAQASLQERINLQLGTLANLWDAASGTFTNALVAFGEAIAPELKQLVDWINSASESVGNWAKANPALAGGLMKVLAVIAVGMTVLGGLTLALASVLGPMMVVRYGFAMLGLRATSALGALKLVGQAILWIGRALLMNPIGIAITAFAVAAFFIYKYWGPIKTFFTGLWSGIKSSAGSAADWIRTKYATMAGGISNIVVRIQSAFSGMWSGIKSSASSVWAELKTAFSGGLLGIMSLIIRWSPVNAFYQAFAAVLSWFGVKLPAQFSQFGSMMLQGLISGITSGLGAVKNAIINVGSATVGWFKEKLGIHSPSRVFAQLGGFTMAGLDQGLTAGQKGPLSTVIDFTKRVTAVGAGIALAAPAAAGIAIDSRPPIGAGAQGGSAASGGNTYVFQIYAAPGMDEQQLARLVQQKIEEAERGKLARARSRLSDRD